MKILAIDDEKLALLTLTDAIKEAEPTAEVYSFSKVQPLLKFAEQNQCNIAFLDIEMRSVNGLKLALKLKEMNPKINIIFVTGHKDYTLDAVNMRASGYVLKPVTADALRNELDNLRFPYKKLSIQTFGNFEVFHNGNPLHFARSKSKELFAYLVDRRGSFATMPEIAAILWENREYNLSLLNQIHCFLSDIMKQLRSVNAENVIVKYKNMLAISPSMVDCDYYRFLDGDTSVLQAFTNEYMRNYSWAEPTAGKIYKNIK